MSEQLEPEASKPKEDALKRRCPRCHKSYLEYSKHHRYCRSCKRELDAKYARKKRRLKNNEGPRDDLRDAWRRLSHEDRIQSLAVSIVEELGSVNQIAYEVRDMLNTSPPSVRLLVIDVVVRIMVEQERINLGHSVSTQEEVVYLNGEIRKKDAIIKELRRMHEKTSKMMLSSLNSYKKTAEKISAEVKVNEMLKRIIDGEPIEVTVDEEVYEESPSA